MSYVFFDLEWNQGYPHSDMDRRDEIIQIGACRLTDWQAEGDMFSAYVRPSIHRKLHHRVRKMLPLQQTDVFRADRFPEVITRFFDWCGEDAIFFTWGPSDARVLDLNLIWYGLEEYLSIEVYDLQRAFDVIVRESDQQSGLKDAVEALGLDADLTYHNACNDAFYTAKIGAEMIRRLGALPSEEDIAVHEAQLHQRRREQAGQQAVSELNRIFAQEEPMTQRDCGFFHNPEDCLKSRSTRVFRCPKCDTRLCNGNWYQLGDTCVARSRCMDHGRFYSMLRQAPERDGWRADFRLYNDDVFPSSLFSLCKLSGETITLRKLPRKRKRSHKRTKTITVKPVENTKEP